MAVRKRDDGSRRSRIMDAIPTLLDPTLVESDEIRAWKKDIVEQMPTDELSGRARNDMMRELGKLATEPKDQEPSAA